MAHRFGSTATLGISYKEAHKQINRQIEFFKYLRSKEFHIKRKKRIEAGLQSITQQAARNAVKYRVYDAYQDPGGRTMKLYKSIKSQVGGGKDTEAVAIMYSDPKVAPSKMPGLEKYSYAAYFIDPVNFHTFLLPRRKKSRNTYRPFFKIWETFMQTFMPHWIKQKTEAAILSAMPKGLRS